MASKTTPTEKTFTGGCHCGFIKYTLAYAIPENPIASRCNCTVCQKPGFTSIKPAERSDFKIISPAKIEDIPTYSYRVQTAKKYFCDKCGVQVWGEGSYEWEGKVHEYMSVNLHTIDQPQEGIDLSEFKIEYWDGLNDNWMAGQKKSPFAGGIL